MPMILLETPVAGSTMAPKEFVQGIIGNVTSTVSLADVAAIVGVIIVAGIGGIIAWKFGRKGFNFIKNTLTGKGGKI